MAEHTFQEPATRSFTERAGKVAFLNVFNDPPDWQALEISFTDGTLFHFESLMTLAQIKAKYMKVRQGNLRLIRNYGIRDTDEEKNAR